MLVGCGNFSENMFRLKSTSVGWSVTVFESCDLKVENMLRGFQANSILSGLGSSNNMKRIKDNEKEM